MKQALIAAVVRRVLWFVALIWCRTLRISFVRRDAVDDVREKGKNFVVAFWHGSMFVGWFLHRPANGERVSALVSQSDDGEYLSIILERWKYSMIRGSSHIGGKEAMMLMTESVRSGSTLAITPDGPRGPRHEMKMGAVRTAQLANVPLILCGIGMRKKRSLRSWDRFEVPLPFSRIAAVYDGPFVVPEHLEGEPLDHFKRTMEQRLNELQKHAEETA